MESGNAAMMTLERTRDGAQRCAPHRKVESLLLTSLSGTFKGWQNLIAFRRVMSKRLYKSGRNIANTKVQVWATPGLAENRLRIPKHAWGVP